MLFRRDMPADEWEAMCTPMHCIIPASSSLSSSSSRSSSSSSSSSSSTTSQPKPSPLARAPTSPFFSSSQRSPTSPSSYAPPPLARRQTSSGASFPPSSPITTSHQQAAANTGALYLGSWVAAVDDALLADNRIRAIVEVLDAPWASTPATPAPGAGGFDFSSNEGEDAQISRYKIAIPDSSAEGVLKPALLDGAVRFIAERLARGQNVLVHCQQVSVVSLVFHPSFRSNNPVYALFCAFHYEWFSKSISVFLLFDHLIQSLFRPSSSPIYQHRLPSHDDQLYFNNAFSFVPLLLNIPSASRPLTTIERERESISFSIDYFLFIPCSLLFLFVFSNPNPMHVSSSPPIMIHPDFFPSFFFGCVRSLSLYLLTEPEPEPEQTEKFPRPASIRHSCTSVTSPLYLSLPSPFSLSPPPIVLKKNGRSTNHLSYPQGISRSASIVTAYLMRTRALSFDDALALVRAQRPCVRPNSGFQKALRAWAAAHPGSSSTSAAPVRSNSNSGGGVLG